MSHPLVTKLAQVRRRVRLYVLLKAVAQSVALVVMAATVLALADALFRFQDRGLRALLSLGLLAAAGVGLRWIVRAVRGSRYGDVQIAQRVEQAFPQLRGRLASAISFLDQREDDAYCGSPQLRRAVVLDVAARVEGLDLTRTLDAGPARRAGLVACAALVLVGALFLLHPGTVRIAAQRLANPLGAAQWPRANQLTILDPVERLPLGQTFEVQVVDAAGAALPDDVMMHYRYQGPDGTVIEESEPMQKISGQLLARRESVQRPFEYRALGGDDRTMRWIPLEIVEPPALRDSTVTLHYPAYTGWPSATAALHFRALVGTTVDIRAVADKPLQSAHIRLGDSEALPAKVSSDGLVLTIPADQEHPFRVAGSGAYWFDLEDQEGFHSAERPKYEIRAVPDDPPTATIEHPRANIFVTPEATLPLSMIARDDLAIRRIVLHTLRSDQSAAGDQELPLFAAPDEVPDELAAASAAENYPGDSRELSYDWDLKPLALPPGTQLTFHIAAEDYAGQVGQSLPRRLTIVTPDEIQDRLAERQTLIFDELSRVLELEQTARSHVTRIEVQLDQTKKLTQSDIDALQGAGMNQQQVDRELTSEQEGLRAQIADFLDQLTINKIDGPDTRRQMQGVLDELERLADGPLPTAARELTAATKAAQVALQERSAEKATPAAQLDAPLRAAGAAQDDVVAALERMMDEMKQRVNYRHFHREIGQLGKAQEELANETAALGQQTLTKPFEDLNPQQRADLQKVAQRELELARRLERLEQRMDETAAATRQEDPLVADTVADALAHARGQGIGERMRQAGQSAAENKIGQANQQQKQVAQDLNELLDILSNRREHELGRLVKKLREAEEKLERIAAEQAGLRKKMAAAAEMPEEQRRQELERLSRQEKKLEEEVDRLARSLQRLQADKASARAAQAGENMKQAAHSGSAGEASSATDKAAAAQRDLEEAQRELAEQRQKAEADLAQEQMARMEDALTSMRERQEKLIYETRHYQQQQELRGQLARAEAASVRDLSRQQLALRDESQEMAKTLGGAEVFRFVLEVAGTDMAQAAGRLDRRELGEDTIRFETSAMERLAQIIAALGSEDDAEEPAAKPEEQGAEGGEGGEGGQGEKQQARQRSLAELKLLKLVQEQINNRTRTLAEAHRDAQNLSDDEQNEFAQLSEEQGRLADLIANMISAEDEKPEDDPDRLPDLRKQSPDGEGADETKLPEETP